MIDKKSSLLIICIVFLCANSQAQNWALMWSDSFTNATINPNNWKFEIGTGTNGWGNNELEYYTARPENATIKNGNLCIIAKSENYQGSNYTSARMISKDLKQWTYGKIEARIKLPQTQGVWPAFWMLGSNISQVSWPECGEIDIMEHINTDPKIHGTMHWNNNGHVYYGGSTNCAVTNYHTYAIEWNADSINWYLDNVKYWTANIKNNINNTNAFHKPYFLILNMAVGGNWPGSPNASSVFPDTMFVDYINVYQKFATATSNIKNVNTINIYPNPAQDFILFDVENKNNDVQIFEIYNSVGKVLYKQELMVNTNSQKINIANRVSGIYFYRIKNNNSILHNGRFVKE